jgi:hypothetical protein
VTTAAATPCPDDSALVVVDPQRLETGEPIARCAQIGNEQLDGAQALDAAGFAVTGTTRFGRSFVCRIDDRPSVDERLSYAGRNGYRETCSDTPPTGAYWSYWVAEPGACVWRFSSAGAMSHDVAAGAAEGWSFALDTTSGNAPAPRVGPCDVTPAAIPTTASTTTTASTDAPAGRVDPIVGIIVLVILMTVVLGAAARRRRRARPGESSHE